MKKAKNIHLTEGAIKALSIMAIEQGTNFKNFVESHLEALSKPNGFEKSKERGAKKKTKNST
jgi:hypothetical protein